MSTFDTPVLFLIFNRPGYTKKVFEQIKAIKPRQLFIAADGPRNNVAEDVANCRLTREIIKEIDWDCNLNTLFRDHNLTSRYAISTAISWFFDAVEEGIILEDDTLPDASFFTYCQELLQKYRDVPKVRHINGSNFLLGKKFTDKDSYYFSNYCHPWGWATWRRSWKDFDVELPGYDESHLRKRLSEITNNVEVVNMWVKNINDAVSKRIDCWDFQWFYTMWMTEGMAITPAVNLITNIGFGNFATNTTYTHTRIGNMKRTRLEKIYHPVEIIVNTSADEYAMSVKLKEGIGNILQRAKAKIKLIIGSGTN